MYLLEFTDGHKKVYSKVAGCSRCVVVYIHLLSPTTSLFSHGDDLHMLTLAPHMYRYFTFCNCAHHEFFKCSACYHKLRV